MKIALISDIHHGPLSHNKAPGWDCLRVVREFAAFASEAGADLLLDLGDRISDTTLDADRVAEREVKEAMAAFTGPRMHLLGNHDVAKLTPDDNALILGQPMGHRVIAFDEARVIAFEPDVVMTKPTGFAPVAAEHIDWLVAALEADERPAIIATHLPFSGHSQVGNFYFESVPQFSMHCNAAGVRAAVEATGRAAVWLSGHVHWTTVTTVQGIHHVTLHSLSETFTTSPQVAGSYGLLEVADGQLEFTVFGREPMSVRLPFRRSGDQRWIPPLAPWWVPGSQ